MIATGTPFTGRSAYGLNTGSSKSRVRTFCARNSIGPELVLDGLAHALGAIGEFPMRRHEIHAQALLRADHVGAAGPERGRRALPAVAAVEEQRARPRGAQPLDQRGEMGVAAEPAVAPRRRFEIEMRERVGAAARRGCRSASKRLADEVRRLPFIGPAPRLTLGSRKYTGRSCACTSVMCRSETLPNARHIVELGRGLRAATPRPQARARRGGQPSSLEEFAPAHATATG